MAVIGDGAMTDADWFAEYKAALNAIRVQLADRARELERENRALWAALGYTRQAAGGLLAAVLEAINAGDAPGKIRAEDAKALLAKADALADGVVPLAPAGGAGSGAGA